GGWHCPCRVERVSLGATPIPRGGEPMKLSLVPAERIFYDYFRDDAANAVTAANALREMVRSFADVRAHAERIKALESEGDTITRTIFARLNRTFITPIDREDIIALASIMD